MGMCAHIYLISPEAYSAAARGDIEDFDTGQDGIVENLDKAWHAIHYLVTGDQELRFLLEGVQIDPVSEPFEAHSPQLIVTLSQRLASTSPAALMANFDPDKFNALHIYPGPWDVTAAAYIEGHLTRFFSVVRRAAEQGKGIAVFLG
jgi:hypothetical protein